MFDTRFKFRESEKHYDLTLYRDTDWFDSEKRVLIILQTVTTAGLKGRDLLFEPVRTTLVNCVKEARQRVRLMGLESPTHKFAVVNFNNRKHLDLSRSGQAEAEAEFTTRCHKLIKKLRPTHVFVSGDEAAAHLLPKEGHHAFKRGTIYKNQKMKWATTFDLERALAKNCEQADTLGIWCQHLAHLLVGKHPYDLSHVQPRPVYINTIARFDKMMDRIESLGRKDQLAVDTETLNLGAYANAIFTIQFALSTDPDRGFVLPIRHPRTPFTDKEIKYIHKRLRKFFGRSKNLVELVTFNGTFDLKVVRTELTLPIIYHPVWEIMAGEHLLDENVASLRAVGPAVGGLAPTLASYNNDFYYTAKFSKEQRSTSGTIEPSDPEFLRYAAMDAQCLLHIRKAQIKRAGHQELADKSYRPWFEAHMRSIMGPTVHVLSTLEEHGSYVDRQYLKHLMGPDSPLLKEMKDLENELRNSKAAQEANRRILALSGMKANSLFDSVSEQWVLKLSKGLHKSILFLEVLGLDPISETKTGEPSIDKEFIEAYKDKCPEVALFGEWSLRQKLLSTYVRGWYKKLMTDPDGRRDGYLRAQYGFFPVVTGRLRSGNPNLQNIPSRGTLSKIIKRMFPAVKGKLLVRFDYSAHEVRMWSVAARDKVLAQSFIVGLELRQKLIAETSKKVIEEIRNELKTKGDVHIQNVKRFFNKWVAKSDPLRDAIKAVVFGTLYGMSAASLGESIGPYATAAKELKKLQLKADADAKTKKQIKSLKSYLKSAGPKQQEKINTEYAQSIIDKMFAEFRAGGKWTDQMKAVAESKGYAYSPWGRKRRLPSVLTGVRSVIARSVRQGSNAPIQGYASETTVRGSRELAISYYKELPTLAEMLSYSDDLKNLWVEFNRVVHDALYHGVPYTMIFPFIHMLQWHATFGLAAKLEKEFNMKFTVVPEIEIEIGARDDMCYKWDWTMPGLAACIDKSVRDAHELGVLDGTPATVLNQIYRPYKNKKVRKYLQENWPLLNVPDLDKQIRSMEKDYLELLKSDPAEFKRVRRLKKERAHEPTLC